MRPIPLARLTRKHGLVRDRVLTLKGDLFSPGGLVFAGRPFDSILVSPKDGAPFAPFPLAGPISPLGGKWGQATGLLLRFPEQSAPPLGSTVALPRDAFPSLEGGEFYVCDILNAEVRDGDGRVVARVTGFEDVAPTLGGSVNLRAQAQGAREEFSFPSSWIARVSVESSPAFVEVPNVEEWMRLDVAGEAPDDADD